VLLPLVVSPRVLLPQVGACVFICISLLIAP